MCTTDGEGPCTLQDFMGFLHLGWDVATKADGDQTVVVEETPAWAAVARRINLNKPGLSIVRQTMAWQPLHMAAMSGDVDLIEELVSVRVPLPCLVRRVLHAALYVRQPTATQLTLAQSRKHQVVCDHMAKPRALLQEHKCDLTVRSVNSWTPLHYAAAYNKVLNHVCHLVRRHTTSRSAVHTCGAHGSQPQVLRHGCAW